MDNNINERFEEAVAALDALRHGVEDEGLYEHQLTEIRYHLAKAAKAIADASWWMTRSKEILARINDTESWLIETNTTKEER